MKAIAEVPARVLAGQFDLHAAWDRVSAKSGMPGVDGMAISRFARSSPSYLRGLESTLARGGYVPLPLRMASIPKKSGARRLLLVPTVRDRIVQSAAAAWLGQRWNADFDAASFAYRPGIGRDDALRRLAELRDAGYVWVLDADIRSFFDSISHSLLFARLEEALGPRSPLVAWIRAWTAAAAWDGHNLYSIARGVPQGSPLSPLLANYFLDPFDKRLRAAGIKLVRYADDFVVLARTPFELAEIRERVRAELAGLQLELSEEKTRLTSFDQVFRFLGAEIRSDSIMLPFKVKRSVKKADFVAPRMSSALLRAWRAGHLKVRGDLKWSDEALPGSAGEDSAPAVQSEPVDLLDKLRSRPVPCGRLTAFDTVGNSGYDLARPGVE